jgi:hypothetical protein
MASRFHLCVRSMIRRRHRIMRPVRHPRHATEKPRRCQPKAFGKTVHLHRLLGINRAGGIETATDITLAPGLQEQPVAFDDDGFVENHRDLFARRPRPIAQHRRCENDRSHAENQAAPCSYGAARQIIRDGARFPVRQKILGAGCAGNRFRPGGQMNDQADKRNQPAEHDDKGAVGRIAARRVLHDPDSDPKPDREADEHTD